MHEGNVWLLSTHRLLLFERCEGKLCWPRPGHGGWKSVLGFPGYWFKAHSLPIFSAPSVLSFVSFSSFKGPSHSTGLFLISSWCTNYIRIGSTCFQINWDVLFFKRLWILRGQIKSIAAIIFSSSILNVLYRNAFIVMKGIRIIMYFKIKFK